MNKIINSNFINKHLIDGEEVVMVQKYPRRAFIGRYILSFFLCVWALFLFALDSELPIKIFSFYGKLTLVFVLLILVGAEIKLRCTFFVITTKKVIRIFSFISRSYVDLRFEDIRNMYYHQGIINRIFNVGSVFLSTAGTNIAEVHIGPVVKYIEFFNAIDQRRGKKNIENN